MNREWPNTLKSYAGSTSNVVTFRPERWVSGQLVILIGACACVVLGATGLIVAPNERLAGIVFVCFGLAAAFFPTRDRLMWVRVDTTDAGIDIVSGWWRITSKSQHIDYGNVQTVRLQSDEKSYGYRLAGYEHVVIEPVTIPLVGNPPGIRVGEMFGLEIPVLEALRDELAARAGKTAVPSTP